MRRTTLLATLVTSCLIAPAAIRAATEEPCDIRVLLRTTDHAARSFVLRIETWCTNGLPRGATELLLQPAHDSTSKAEAQQASGSVIKVVCARLDADGKNAVYSVEIPRNGELVARKAGALPLTEAAIPK